MSTEAYIEMVHRNLKGDLSPVEFAALNEATAKNAELQALRMDIEDAWDISGPEDVVVTKKETDDLFQKIAKKKNNTTIFSLRNMMTGLAAMFVLALGSIWLMRDQTEIYTDEGLVTLADNSTVELRKGSRLEVDGMTDQARSVILTGEAFFNIAKDVNRPFKISTSNTTIEVLGTAFLVKETNESVFVDVEEGRVKFSSKNNPSESLILTKGMKAEYNKAQKINEVQYQNLSAWKEGMYQYTDETIAEIIKELSIIFDSTIQAENHLLNCRINAILTADNLEGILNQLAGQLEIDVTKDGQNWRLFGGECK